MNRYERLSDEELARVIDEQNQVVQPNLLIVKLATELQERRIEDQLLFAGDAEQIWGYWCEKTHADAFARIPFMAGLHAGYAIRR